LSKKPRRHFETNTFLKDKESKNLINLPVVNNLLGVIFMKAVRFFLLGLITILFAFGSGAAQTETTQAAQTVANAKSENEEERYRIGFQDTLEIQVFRHPNLSQKVSVNPDGTITLFRASKPIVALQSRVGRQRDR
jgi:hypothetical protein